MLWKCPKCERSFKNTNQAHSCLKLNLETLFINKDPVVFEIYKCVLSKLEYLKNLRISPVKNSILFAVSSNFMALKPKKKYLDMEFISTYEIKEFPIHKSMKISNLQFANFIKLQSLSDVDDQLINWINEAYINNIN